MIVQRSGKRRSGCRCIRTTFTDRKKLLLFSILFYVVIIIIIINIIIIIIINIIISIIIINIINIIIIIIIIILNYSAHCYRIVRPMNTDTHTHTCEFRWLEMRKVFRKNFTQECLSSPAMSAWFKGKKLND